MKRKVLEQRIHAAGFGIKSGAKHDGIFNAEGKRVSTLPRHKEINELTARAILKQCGLDVAKKGKSDGKA